MEQQRRNVAAACEGEHEARTKPLQPWHAKGRRVGPSPRSPAACRPCPARRRRAWPQLRRWRACYGGRVGRQLGARSRNTTAAAAPPRIRVRSAQRSISSATASSGHGAAWARCHAWRSGSASGSVASAKTRCAARRSPGRPSGRRRSRPVGGGGTSGRRVRSILRLPLEPPRPLAICCRMAAPQQAHVTTGSAAAVSSSCCVSRGSTLKAVFNAALQRRCGGKPNPPASSAGLSPRGNSSSASGLLQASATIRSRTYSASACAVNWTVSTCPAAGSAASRPVPEPGPRRAPARPRTGQLR